MKKRILILIALCFAAVLLPVDGHAQILNKIKNKLNNEADKKVDKAIDKALGKEDTPAPTPAVTEEAAPGTKPTKAAYKSKFDFIPGPKVLSLHDFAEDPIGDAPAGWEINGSAEVVTLDDIPGKYVMLSPQSAVVTTSDENFPEDVTIQFDLICTDPFTWGSTQLYFALGSTDSSTTIDGTSENLGSRENPVLWLSFHPATQTSSSSTGYGTYKLYTPTGSKDGPFTANGFLDKGESRWIKVSIWRQKRRIRLYVNENKVLDLPTILPEGMQLNTLAWRANNYFVDDRYFVGNIRVAGGLVDTRKEVKEAGKFVTTGILFDTNSDVIKSESYGVLKDIANMLKETPAIKMTIIGHTDSDGDEAKNLILSQKRAAAVKKSLNEEFEIDPDRLQTDGKGETEPAVPNDSPQNKANNRRVEFVTITE